MKHAMAILAIIGGNIFAQWMQVIPHWEIAAERSFSK